MGQAAVLPDPLDETAVPMTSADDLLSQLAGEEIDRLLAESEAAAPSVAPAERPGGGDVDLKALAKEVERSGEIRGLSSKAGTAPADTDDAPAPPVTTAASVAPAAMPSPAPALAPAPEAVAAAPATSVVLPTAEAATTTPVAKLAPEQAEPDPAAERAALNAVLTESAAASADADDAEVDAGALPIYLKPLEWLNAPFAACPDPLREALGKVAILTLANALAVLAYVVLFRR